MCTKELAALFIYFAGVFDLEPKVIASIAEVESSYRPNVVGTVGEVGLMQLRPEYSQATENELLNPYINVREGTRFLSKVKKHCIHQGNYQWVICYNRGLRGGRRVTSVPRTQYYQRFMKAMERNNCSL